MAVCHSACAQFVLSTKFMADLLSWIANQEEINASSITLKISDCCPSALPTQPIKP